MYAKRCVLAVVGAALLTLGVLVRIDVEGGVDVGKVTVSLSLRSDTYGTSTGSLTSTSEPRVEQPELEVEQLEDQEAEAEASANLNANPNCAYSLTAFDRTGKLQSQSNSCLESDADLLAHLVSLSGAVAAYPSATAVVAIGVVGDRQDRQNLDALGLVADEFLASRMEWRIMAERFDFFEELSTSEVDPGNNSNNNIINGNATTTSTGKPPPPRLFYDPAVHASAKSGTFADPFSAALRTLLTTTGSSRTLLGNGDEDGDGVTITGGNLNVNDVQLKSALNGLTVDLILLRVFEEKLAAFAGALRRFQFPGNDVDVSVHADSSEDLDCAADLARNQGRTFVKYGGPKDL